MSKYFLLAASIGLTVYAQLILKWRVMHVSPMPDNLGEKLRWALGFVFNPWILSCFLSGFLIFVTWSLVVRQMPLSRAYPFMGLSFIFVACLSAVFFGESLSFEKFFGTVLIVIGLAFVTQG